MWWYKRILNNCKKATYLLEKKHNEGIGYLEEYELRLHLRNCHICRRYNDQSRMIDQMVRQLYYDRKMQVLILDDSFKSELKGRIEKELKQN